MQGQLSRALSTTSWPQLLFLLLFHITVTHTVAYEQCDRPSISGNRKASTSPLTKAQLAHYTVVGTSKRRARANRLTTTKYSLVWVPHISRWRCLFVLSNVAAVHHGEIVCCYHCDTTCHNLHVICARAHTHTSKQECTCVYFAACLRISVVSIAFNLSAETTVRDFIWILSILWCAVASTLLLHALYTWRVHQHIRKIINKRRTITQTVGGNRNIVHVWIPRRTRVTLP